MPGLCHQLTQTAHNAIMLIVSQIIVIQLCKAGIHRHQFMDQRTAGNFSRMRGQHQLNGKLIHGLAHLFIGKVFGFQLIKQRRQSDRITGRLTVRRNAVILLRHVG